MHAFLLIGISLLVFALTMDLLIWRTASIRKQHADLRERIKLLDTVEYLPDLFNEQTYAVRRLQELETKGKNSSLEHSLVLELLVACNKKISSKVIATLNKSRGM